MGETYGAELYIEGYTEVEQLPEEVQEAMRGVGCWPGELEVSFSSSEDRFGKPDDDEKYIIVNDGMASYGISQWTGESGPELDQVLCDHGIEFSMSDEGKYEIPGENVYWKRGMDKPLHRTVAGDEIAMTEREFKSLRCEDPADTIRAIEAYYKG